MNIRVGQVLEIRDKKVDAPLEVDLATMCNTHTATQGVTGAGKTSEMMLFTKLKNSPEIIAKYGSMQHVLVDEMGVMGNIAKAFPKYKIISPKSAPKIFNEENAFNVGKEIRRMGISAIIDPSEMEDESEKRKIIGGIVSGIRHAEKEFQHICFLDVDEIDVYANSKKPCRPSKEILIDAAKRGRNTNLILTVSTQRINAVDIDIRSQCTNLIFGKTIEPDDCDRASKMMCGSTRMSDRFRMLEKGQFFVRGDIFHKTIGFDYALVQLDKPDIALGSRGTEQEQVKAFTDLNFTISEKTNDKEISDEAMYRLLSKN